MSDLSFIRDFYQPIQPAVGSQDSHIAYTESSPHPDLQDFIYCYWQLRTKERLHTPYDYRVVSDGCIDNFFNRQAPQESFVMGFCRKFTQFPIGQEFSYAGIRFLPSAFTLLFGIDAKSLSNRDQWLKEVLPNLAQWIEKTLNPERSFSRVVNLLDQKMVEYIRHLDLSLDTRFFKALEEIFIKRGYLETDHDISTGLSPRQLRRIFNYYIGTTPKAFSQVVRFQQILNAKPSKQALRENKLYYDLGFFDQAHFIKDFKKFYGVTPAKALGRD